MSALADSFELPTGPGLHAVRDDRMREIGFVLARVPADGTGELDTADREALVVKLEGPAGAIFAGTARFELPARASVFDDPPSAVYVPPGTTIRLPGELLAGVFLSPASRSGAPDPYAILPDDVETVTRGKDNFTRAVRDILPRHRPAQRLLAGETINPPGNWSSAPPHKHDREAPPDEGRLEEIYVFRVDPRQGFGLQGSYSDERGERGALLVRDLDAVTIPGGYHPVAAAPGYRLYYLWGLAGERRELLWHPDPAHAWVDR